MRQLVQQCTCGTRSSSYSTRYRYAAAARPAMHKRDKTSSSVGNICSSSCSNAQAGRDIPQCGSYYTGDQRQCEHAASNAKRERVSTTPNTPLPHASSTPTAPLTRVSYTCYTNCYNTQKGKMVLPLLRTLPLRTPPQILLAIPKLLES